MLEAKNFIAQCRGAIIGTMVADEMNDWPSSLCCVRQLGLPRRRPHNEDGSSNGGDFATFGTDEIAKLPETHTLVDGIKMESTTASRTGSR